MERERRRTPAARGETNRALAPASSIGDFCASPLRRYVAGRSFVLWAASPTLVGAVYFARPLEDEWEALVAAEDDVARHASLRPPYAVHSRFPAALFQERAEAFAWLGRDDALRVGREITALVDSLHGTPPVMHRLRAHLAAAGGRSTLHQAARALGVAARSLQRHLLGTGTTFRGEIDRSRIALAERLLVASDAKIETVARRSGFASSSHLSRVMRRQTGETPAEFRERRRVG